MNYNDYAKYISAETLMGPNSLRILEELFCKYPLVLTEEDAVLDLGCGKGLTSLAIAGETGARVYANDLWISAEENAKRFEEWGVSERLLPVCEDANHLNFEKRKFQALVSIDSYHYFAGEKGFFETKLLPFLKENAVVLIGIPGIKEQYAGRSEELLSAWLGEEAYMFKSPLQWKELIGTQNRIERVVAWEMECFESAWNEWFATQHKYACEDQLFYESLIKPFTCFVGIYVKLI